MNIHRMPSHLTRWIPALKRVAESFGVTVNYTLAAEVVFAAEAQYQKLYARMNPLNRDEIFANCLKMVFKNNLDSMAKRKAEIKKTFVSEWVQPKLKILKEELR
ncbi:MAG: hypothetical protein HQK96_08020 [Nitrospirae bacterium]|nr:hypothetical protein [Nitrospirota bacterium]